MITFEVASTAKIADEKFLVICKGVSTHDNTFADESEMRLTLNSKSFKILAPIIGEQFTLNKFLNFDSDNP
jgi:hypothetical protein